MAGGSLAEAAMGQGPDGQPQTATAQPAWAKRLQRRQQISQATATVAHTLRGGDAGGSAQGPRLKDPSDG
jgi:type IV secretion system protein TrbL